MGVPPVGGLGGAGGQGGGLNIPTRR